MKVKEIAYSGYTITDMKRSRSFYEGVLGLKPNSVFEQDGMGFIEYWLGKDEHQTLVLGMGAPNFKPGPTGATVAFEVEDFDVAIMDLKTAKTKFVMEPYETGVCFMALVSDPDKNLIMIHKRKEK